MALMVPIPASAAEGGKRERATCPFVQKIAGGNTSQQDRSANREDAPPDTKPESGPAGPDRSSGSGSGSGGGSGGGAGGRPFAISSTGQRGTKPEIPTLPSTPDIPVARPEPPQGGPPKPGNIDRSTPDDEIWRWLVIGEIKLPRSMQCGNRSVVTSNIINQAQDNFDAYVRPGSAIDTPANRQTFNRNQQLIRDALIGYARDPESGACAVVEATNRQMGFVRPMQIAAQGLDVRGNTSGPSGLTMEQRVQWDQFMQEFNGIMEGVTDPSTVSGQLDDWYNRFRQLEAYLVVHPPSLAGQAGQGSVGGTLPSGEGWLAHGFTLSGLADSFGAAQAQADQATTGALSLGATGILRDIGRIK